jgi:NAD(P)H-nitrite reductase large subunit
LTWDELVFATGSTPFIPPVPGHDLPHVHGFRRISDVQAILAGVGRWLSSAVACWGLKRLRRCAVMVTTSRW